MFEPTDQMGSTTNDNDESGSLKELQQPFYAGQFREFCGNPSRYEDHLRHIEHHTAMLINNNHLAATKAQIAAKKAQDRDLNLAAKEEQLRRMVQEAINEIGSVLQLEENAHYLDTSELRKHQVGGG